MITPNQIRDNPLPIISMVFHLLDRNCIDGAKIVADDICSQLSDSFTSGKSFQKELVGAYVKMIVRLEADPQTSNSKRIASLSRLFPLLSADQLGDLIVDLQSSGSSEMNSLKNIRTEFLTQVGSGNISEYEVITRILEMSVGKEDHSFASHLVEKICSGLLETKKQESGKAKSTFKEVKKSQKKYKKPHPMKYRSTMSAWGNYDDEMGEEEEDEMGEEEEHENYDDDSSEMESDPDDGYKSASPVMELPKFSFLKKLMSSDLWKDLSDTLKDLIQTTSFKVIQQWITEKLKTDESDLKSSGIQVSKKHDPYVAVWNGYGYSKPANAPPKTHDDQLQVEIISVIKLYLFFEKIQPSPAGQAKKNGQLFSPLFAKMSLQRLTSLMNTIYTEEPNVKQIPNLLDFCRTLGISFINRPELREYLKSFGNVVVTNLFLYMCWTGSNQTLFAQKILAVYLEQLDSPLITKIVGSPEIQKVIATAPPENREAFLMLLDRKISTLSAKVKVPVPEFSWKQPNASFPSCPPVQEFLRSSNETMTYANFPSIAEARKFSTQLSHGQSAGNYSVRVVEKGVGKNARCEISKTQEIFQKSTKHTDKLGQELSNLTQLRLTTQQLVIVAEPSAAGPSKRPANTKKKGNKH